MRKLIILAFLTLGGDAASYESPDEEGFSSISRRPS